MFFDEIQKIPEWQDAINSFKVDFECDIYIIGSNAFLLSSEYVTYLAGRSVEIKVFSLSFIEFIDFYGYKIIETKPAVQTVQSYISTLLEAYIFYEIKRFDIKWKEYLKTLGKYYIVDIGLRNYLLGFRNRDIGHSIENIVYFELLRREYDVAIGKIGENEIDFIK